MAMTSVSDALAGARTLLFVPGDQPTRLDRAFRSGADAIVIDLEDAVQPSRRAQARSEIAAWFPSVREASDGPLVMARVNAHDTSDHPLDIAAMLEVGVPALVATKFDDDAADAWNDAGAAPVAAIIETARGLRDIFATRTLPACVERLAFGAVDYSADIRVDWSPTNPALNWARAQVVVASKALGLPPPIDTAFIDLTDSAAYESDCRMAKDLGYGGKFVIHPSQIEAADSTLRSNPAAREWARRVVDAWGSQSGGGKGAFCLDGEMIDAAVVRRARGILAHK
jgi:citrate lyase subunit beta/citryl-CoA lyase